MFRFPDYTSVKLAVSGAVANAAVLTALLILSGCNDKAGKVDHQITASERESVKVNEEPYGFGQAATQAQIAGWDIDIRPDGLGLPEGKGSVEDGEWLYEDKCASCHGTFGEGEGRWPKLAGGMDTLSHERPDKTVGSYWPYASTLWDYIRRAMPFTAPQSLANDEVYAITAYVLYLNDLVEDDFVLTRSNFSTIEMPNKDGFFVDDRPDVSNPRCLSDCLDPETIRIVETIAGITPTKHIKEGGTDAHAYNESEVSHNASDNTAAVAPSQGKTLHDSACKVCHGSGVGGAPITGFSKDWIGRVDQNITILYQHALEGFQGNKGVMPAKGGQMHLDNESVKAAVDYMLEQSR